MSALRAGGAIAPIQYLRAVAALLVVFHHTRAQMPWLANYLPEIVGESLLFFVISGFLMVLTTHGKDITRGEFLRRRLVRVVPLYWLMTLGVAAAALAAPGLFRSVTVTLEHTVLSLLFVAHSSPSHPQLWPLLVPGWTLVYEVAFYAAFALFLGTRALIPALVGLVVAGQFLEHPITRFYTSPLLLEFVAGMLLCKARLAGWRLPVLPAAITVSAGAYLLLASPSIWAKVAGAGLIVAGAVLCDAFGAWRSRIWLALGEASYSLYLSHLFTLGAMRVLWPKMQSSVSAWLFLAACVVACSVVGLVMYRVLEAPLGRMFRDFGTRRATITQGA